MSIRRQSLIYETFETCHLAGTESWGANQTCSRCSSRPRTYLSWVSLGQNSNLSKSATRGKTPHNSMWKHVYYIEVLFFSSFFRCDVSWSKNTHRVHTRPRLPLSLGAPPPAPSALRSTATLHSAQTHCSGSGGSRRCRRSRLHRGREEKMSLVGEENNRDCYGAVTSRLGQFQRLLAVLQTSSCDHKLHRTKKLPTGATDHILNCSSR